MITRGEGRERTVYLAERAPELRFFGGYWAMPGGTLADEDLAAVGAPDAPDAPGTPDEARALQACAHRELFEELGLLRHRLPSERSDGEQLRDLRRRLLEHEQDDSDARPPSPWPGIVDGTVTPLPLRELCRIETPAFAPVRYDTVFYHVPLEDCTGGTAGTHPDIWPGELVQGRFWLPEQALASWRNGDLLLVPPVVILLEHLARAADFEHFAREISQTTKRYRRGHLHQVRFSPGVVLAPLRTPTLPPATTTNCYIVGHDELWIVDPGSPYEDEQRRLLELLDELTADGRRLGGVLLTHHHPDHVGGVAALCEARGLRAHGHPLTLERLDPAVPRGEAIEHGQLLPLGRAPDHGTGRSGGHGWTLEALHTPGHDRGHLCFHESRYGTMLVGDMLSTISTIVIDPPEGNLAHYLQSLELLTRYPVTTLYPAHGPALRDGRRLVQKYLRHRRQRETTLVKTLAEAPGTVEDLVPKVYWDADPRLFGFAARSLLAGLEKLQHEGRAEHRDGRWHLLT